MIILGNSEDNKIKVQVDETVIWYGDFLKPSKIDDDARGVTFLARLI